MSKETKNEEVTPKMLEYALNDDELASFREPLVGLAQYQFACSTLLKHIVRARKLPLNLQYALSPDGTKIICVG